MKKKINTKKLKSFYQNESSEEMRSFVNDCVSSFLEYANDTVEGAKLNPAKLAFLEDLGLLSDATA